MVEIITLIIAFFALMNGSVGVGATFVAFAAAAASWRAYQTGKKLDKAQRELHDLRSEMRHSIALSERALQIAAETANNLSAKRPTATEVAAEPLQKTETTAKASNAFPPVVEKPAVSPPPVGVPQETPQVVQEWAASTRTSPPIAPKITPPAPATTAKPIEPVAPPTRSAPPVTVHAARSAPPYIPPPRKTAPRKSMGERLRSALALEEILGTNWLNKIGVIILVLGVALFGIYELGQLGPFGKVGLSLAVAATLLGGGIYLERKERYKTLGRTGIGGGWALMFFTAYAMNHVLAMRVMTSDVLDSILMLVVAGVMVAHTLR
jgi:hypothetical protein